MAEGIGVLEIALGVDLGELVSGMSKGQQVVAGFVAGVTELAEKAVEAAEEAQTAASQIAGIFGKLAPDVDEFAERFAQSAGRAKSDIQGLVASFGGMIAPMMKNKEVAAQMSEGLTEMAVNLAKAAHISTEQAMGALQGGLAGHGRELARLGVSMDDTTMKTQAHHDKLGDVSGLSQAQKSMVAYQVIMQQFQQVQARAAEQSGTLSEQMEELGASTKEAAEAFGADLLPYAEAGAELIGKLVGVIAGMSPQMRQAIEAAAALAAGIGTLATVTVLAGTEFAEAGVEALTAWGAALLPAAALASAVGGVVLAVGLFEQRAKAAGLTFASVGETINDIINYTIKPAISSIGDTFAAVWEGVKDGVAAFRDFLFGAINGMLDGIKSLMQALGESGHAGWATEMADSIGKAQGAMEHLRQSMTAANMGAGMSSIGDSLINGAHSAADVLRSAGNTLKDLFVEGATGAGDIFKKLMNALGGSTAKQNAPAIAGLTNAQIAAEAGPKKGGYSGPESEGFSHAQLGNSDQAADAAFAKVNDAITQATTGLTESSQLEQNFFREQSDSIDQSKEMFDEANENQSILGTAMSTFYQTATEAFAYGASKMQSTITGGLGQVGAAIQAGIAGAQAGGIWGALIAVFMQLMQSCQGFQQVLNVLNSTGDVVANAFTSVFQAILPLVGSIQSLTADVFSGVSKLLSAFSPIFNLLGVIVQDIEPIFTSIGNSFADVGTVLTQIFTALAPLFSMLSNVIQALMSVFTSIMQAGQGLFGIIMDVLAPVFKLIGYILQGLGIVIDGIMLGLADAWNGIAAAIAYIANGIIGVLNTFVNGINSLLGFLGVHLNQIAQLSQQSISIDTSGLQQSLTNMENQNYTLTDSQGALIAATDQAAAALTNLPTGYKIALTEFQNMNYGNNPGVTGNTAAGNTATTTTGVNGSAGGSYANLVTTTGGAPSSTSESLATATGSSSSANGGAAVSGNVGTNAAMDFAQQAYNQAMLSGQSASQAEGAAYTAAFIAILQANPGIGMLLAAQQAEQDATAAQSAWNSASTNASGGGGAQARLQRRGGSSSAGSSSSSSTSAPASGGGATGTVMGENGETINVTINSVTIVSNNPQQVWQGLQKVMRTAAMAKQGRGFTTTAGASRFSLPSDSR